MKIDKKHFPPITILDEEKFTINVDKRLGINSKDGIKMFQNYVCNIIPDAKENVWLSTKLSDKNMCKYNHDCISAYMKDPHKKSFSGCYLDMGMSIPSMDLFSFFPTIRSNNATGRREEAIACVFASIQGDNYLMSHGAVTFSDYKNCNFHVESSFGCMCEEEKEMTINYLVFLLELNCFLEYGDNATMNIVTIGSNQRKVLPDGGGIVDNSTGLTLKCVCAPKGNAQKPDR